MKKIDLNENEVVFAPKGGRPGYLINGRWFPVNKDDLNTPALKRELERYARLRGQEQLKRDQESLKSQSSQSTQPPKPQFPDLRGGDAKVDGYGNPKVDYTKPQTQSIPVEPYTPPTTTPPTPTPTPNPNVVVSPKTGEKTEFERRLPTTAELKAAQSARKTALASGASKGEAEYQAVKAGVGVSKPNPTAAVTGGVNPRAGSYAAYQNNILKQLGSDYGRLPQNTIKPVAKRTMKQEAYDLVLDYLLSEGHVDTVEEAHYVMLQMTSEHVQDIVEGKYSDSVTYVKGTAPVRASYGGKPESFTKETYKKKGKV